MTTRKPPDTSKTPTQPFKINIPQSTLDGVQERLEQIRWTNEPQDSGWSMGASLVYMKDLVDYWQHKYDWRKQEAKLNQFNHFKAEVDGVEIHFIHERGQDPNPTPIILTHGWPDSFYRFYKVIPMLTDPEKFGGKGTSSLDVVVPSMPASVVTQLRQAPFWPALEDIAHTLVYESTLLGDMPALAERMASIPVSTLVISGGDIQARMLQAAQAVADALPTASYRSLSGQTHDIVPAVLAPVLEEFFAS